MNIIRKIHQFNQVLNDHVNLVRNTEDIYCMGLMNNVLSVGEILPFTFMSLRPFAIAFAINELMVNKRQMIVEFGSGISTIILARAIQVNGLSCKLISVESDESWIRETGKILEKEGLLTSTDLIHAPLTLRNYGSAISCWYDELTLKERMKQYPPADMVLIDGPAAYEHDIELSRYFALPFLIGHLAKDHCIFLDDANRRGEKKVIDMWKKDFGKEFRIFAETLGVHYTGKHLDCCPLKYLDKK